MVGILTMASPVEDYGIRPCKKQRKDDDPPVKTITNYFSPLAKSVAKVFSPKSNNIRDYFKSTQPTKEGTPGTSEICDNVMTVNTLKDPQSPVTISQKARKRKRQRKKVDLQSIQGDGEFSDNPQTVTITSDDSHQSQDVGSTCMNVSFIGSDTAALLAQICNENEVSETGEQLTTLPTSTSNDCKKKAIEPSQQKKGRSRSMTWKRKFEDGETSSATKSVEYVSDKPEKEEASKSDSTERLSSSLIQSGSSCTNSSLEVHADETSLLHNDSVVTVSFEDFLKSHTDAGQAFGAEPSGLENSVSENHADESASGAERGDNTPLSAKALTVQVQVHSSSPKAFNQLKLKKSGKTIASIFLRKNSEPEIECESIYMDEPSEKLNVKRKSNVVIEEEDLELAVLEVGASEWVKPKSTAEERQQFMKAFRQPSSDAGKPSAKKTNKLHDVNEKSLIETGKVDEGSDKESNKLSKTNKKASKEISFEPNIQQCNTGEGKIKKLRKRRTTVEQANDAKSAPSVQNKVETKHMNNTVPKADSPNDNLNEEASPILEKHPIVLRRSSRQRSSDGSQIKSPIISPVADAFASDTAQGDGYSQILTPKGLHQAASGNPDGPVEASTPKMSRRPLRKTSRYKSEMILSPEVHSPIRMRFTRLYRSRKNDSLAEDAVFTPRSNKKVTSYTKTVSEAKKLVKKAKNIQHNLSKCVIETQPPPRRSSRQQAISGRKQDHEMEDCVFIDSSSEITPAAKRKTEKSKLRSLNDVLGKSCKTKSGPGQVKTSVHGRNIKLTTGPVTIIDDSKDTSESSQDEEQFKAKREFLMSGLPDSLKRHIAKTAAALEAYSSASLCYRAVTHVQQKEEGVLMWKLLWPSTPLLTALRQPNAEVKDVTNLGFTLGTFTDARLKQEGVFANMQSGFRSSFSEVVTKCLLEEIKSCNSQFPVKRFLKQFQKRCTENCAFSSTNKEGNTNFPDSEIDSSSMCFSNSERENQGKTVEVADLGSKKRKAFSITEDKTMTQEVNPTVRESCSNTLDKGTIKGKTARASRKKQANDLLEKRKDCEVILIDGATSAIKEPVCEDVLWTEKYQPQDSSELVGNSGAIKKLHSWLKEWKARADLEEKRSQKEKKPSENGQQDAWGQSDFEDDSENEKDDLLCNTVLITGPSGVGKTAAVYACASELGFKVFEVNASCQRSGRQILSQLKEATQSHQVDKQAANAHKPFFFNSTNTSKSPRKLNSPRRVVASPRKSPLVPRGAGMKRGLTPKSLETFFKTSSKDKSAEESLKQPKIRQSMCAYSIVQKEPSVAKEVSKPVEVAEESVRKSATSLILFEEVDVIFEDDLGFLNAIKTFMTTTKRPVILTTSDPSFGLQFDGFFEEIYFKSPSQINVASYLQTLCLAENLRTDVKDLYTLLSLNNCDIRQSVLFLQFWIRSGGGYLKDRTLSVCEKSDVETLPADGGEDAADFNMALPNLNFRLPKCDTGCVENFMGLQDILSPSEDLVSYIKCNIRKTQEWRKLVRLLQKFQMKNVNFIFNNLDLLLPMPVQILPGPNNASETEGENAQAVVPDATSLLKIVNIKPDGDCSPEVSPVKMSMRMKRKRKLGLLDSNLSEGFLTIPSHVPDAYDEAKSETTSAVEDLQQESLKKTVEKKLLSPAEKQCSVLVSQCLDSICKFSDDVSFLDGCLYTDAGDKYESINMEYNWTGGRIKNGVCDGCRVEHHEWWSTQCCGELKAIVEMLSFQSCYLNIAEAMESSLDLCKNLGKDPTDQLTLHVPKYRENVFFAQSAGHASLAKERLSLAKSVFSTGSLMTVGNRQASIMEYLPMLRNICKSEKFKEQGKMKRRYLHYFDGIHLELPKATLLRLAADFP